MQHGDRSFVPLFWDKEPVPIKKSCQVVNLSYNSLVTINRTIMAKPLKDGDAKL
jgi:hypothetical protein